MPRTIVRSDADIDEVIEWAQFAADEDDPYAQGVSDMYDWLMGVSNLRPDEVEGEEEDEEEEGAS